MHFYGISSRQTLTTVLVGTIVVGVREVQLATGAQQQGAIARLGSTECPLDITVSWTADVESPVYSTPIILPPSADGRKQIVLATLRNAVELLEGDGSVRYPWPMEVEGSIFHASPAMHDVDGDGLQDICVCDTNGVVRWFSRGGDGGPHMPLYGVQVGSRRVEKDWYQGLDGDAVEAFLLEGGDKEVGSRSPGRRSLLGFSEEVAFQDDGEPAKQKRFLEGDEDRTDTGPAASLGDPKMEKGETEQGVDGGDGTQYYSAGAYGDDFAAAYAQDVYGMQEPNDDFGGYFGGGYGDDFDWEGPMRTFENMKGGSDFVYVDPHILAAPVFADVDGDGSKEMIVPVSYFFDRRKYAKDGAFSDKASFLPEKYAAGALACWDLKRLLWLWTLDLGQTTADAEKVAYVYASPTVADLDGDGMLEVLVGTALGGLHVFDARTGMTRDGFPLTYDAITSQVAVADVDGDQDLEIIFGDASGTVVCVREDGVECWSRKLPGAIGSMVTLGDVDGDGTLDLVVGVAAEDGSGEVWALNAETGLTLPNFPVELNNRKGISAAITLVDLHERTAGQAGRRASGDYVKGNAKSGGGGVPIGGHGTGIHLLAASEDGHVYVVEGGTGCVNKIDLGERVLSMVLADDLDGDGVLDLLVGTMSGEVVALSTNVPFHPSNRWTSAIRGQFDGFAHGGHQGVYFVGPMDRYENVVGRQFVVSFEIVDRSPRGKGEDNADASSGKPYQVSIFAGSEKLHSRSYSKGGVHATTISLTSPRRSLLRIEMSNGPQQVFEDYIGVGYNVRFYAALKWMVVAPLALAAAPFFWLHPGNRTPLPA